MRPRHCTPLGLRPAISPNVGNSGAEFLVVGVRVRAAPDKTNKEKTRSEQRLLQIYDEMSKTGITGVDNVSQLRSTQVAMQLGAQGLFSLLSCQGLCFVQNKT